MINQEPSHVLWSKDKWKLPKSLEELTYSRPGGVTESIPHKHQLLRLASSCDLRPTAHSSLGNTSTFAALSLTVSWIITSCSALDNSFAFIEAVRRHLESSNHTPVVKCSDAHLEVQLTAIHMYSHHSTNRLPQRSLGSRRLRRNPRQVLKHLTQQLARDSRALRIAVAAHFLREAISLSYH